jgi:DnaJ-class molecular chaperone
VGARGYLGSSASETAYPSGRALSHSPGAPLMSDELIDCPVCDGLGYIACDDGSEIQCEQCDGTGKVPAVQV